MIILPSKLLRGETEMIRQHSFTRWMSADLRQAAVDFSRNIGLVPVYCEHSTDGLTRYLFWNPQGIVGTEVRAGRTVEQFMRFDAMNRVRRWPLLSLHVTADQIYSAVWIADTHWEAAKIFLMAHGITRVDGSEIIRTGGPEN